MGPTHWPPYSKQYENANFLEGTSVLATKHIGVSKVAQWPKVMGTKNKTCFENSEGLSALRGWQEGSHSSSTCFRKTA